MSALREDTLVASERLRKSELGVLLFPSQRRWPVFLVWLAIEIGSCFSGAARPTFAQEVETPNVATSTASSSAAGSEDGKLDALLDMAERDPGRLTEVHVESRSDAARIAGTPSDSLSSASTDFSKAASTGDLLKQIPNVSGRRLSGINVDPRVRGFNSSQLNASANGVTQHKSIQDVDSLFSQIDPGVIQEITVMDGPYTSLYGPGFAFIAAELNTPQRYDHPELHSFTTFNYGTNGQTLYGRENILGGGQQWGAYCTYGVRAGNDYRTGGANPELVPSSYEKWDTMLSLSYDVSSYARVEFDMLHTEYNNVEMPGIVYDLANSADNQYDLRYIVQEDRDGPKQLVLQSWHEETFFHGDASRLSKQQSFYQAFIADVAESEGYLRPVNTLSNGHLVSTGVRALRTFGQTDGPQWTVGADWRRLEQRYLERDVDANGVDVYDGAYYGNPQASSDDFGGLTNLRLPVSERLALTIGGRVDSTSNWLNVDDPIITRMTTEPYVAGLNMPNYTLGMSYAMAKLKMNDHDTLSIGIAFAMRSPDLTELYSNEPFVPMIRFGNSTTDGNSALKPEKNWQFDLGIESKRGPFRYGARGFYATINDYIEPVPFYTSAATISSHYLGRNFSGFDEAMREDNTALNRNGDTCQAGYYYYNIEVATMSGGDLFGEVELKPGVSIFGSMSYVHGENLRPVHVVSYGAGSATVVRTGGAEPLPNMYPFNGRISLRISEPEKDRWGTEFVTRLVNSQHEVAKSLAELPSPAFVTFDLRGYYRVRPNLRVSLSLENLLNCNYYEPGSLVYLNSAGVPTFIREPGFTAILGLDGRF